MSHFSLHSFLCNKLFASIDTDSARHGPALGHSLLHALLHSKAYTLHRHRTGFFMVRQIFVLLVNVLIRQRDRETKNINNMNNYCNRILYSVIAILIFFNIKELKND